MSGNTKRTDGKTNIEFGTVRDANDTIDLRYGVRHATAGSSDRFVVFFNGRTEWIEKYCYLADDLQLPAGTGFLTMDHRGQGASGGARAYVDDYGTFASDAAQVVNKVVGSKPYVILTHSMGGLVGLFATLTGKLTPKAMALSSPLLGMPEKPVPVKLARPLSSVITLAGLGKVSTGGGDYTKIPFERNELTHDAALYKRMQTSPYPVPGVTFGWVKATFAAIDQCFSPAALKNLSAPTLVMGGSAESVVDGTGFRRFVAVAAEHAPVDVQLRIFQGARHELFSEIDQYYDAAIKNAREWLTRYL
jgi:alpha-beta hydrolase superfamily lysophospholipase